MVNDKAARRLVAVVASMFLLAACGAQPDTETTDDGAEVATVAGTATPSARAGKSAPAAERPLIRSDTSWEEEEALQQAWYACMADRGVALWPNGQGGYRGVKGKIPSDVEQACGMKQPETVPERSSRLDPDYADKMARWVSCLRKHGIKASASGNPPVLGFDDGLPADAEFHFVDECQVEAFGA